jgi:signal transduction histidine kinase
MMLLGTGYYLAAFVGIGFRFQHSSIGVVWPANALLLSALLLSPRKKWWMVLAVVALSHTLAMGDLVPGWRVAWQIVGNFTLTAAMVEVLRRCDVLPLHFGSRRQILVFMAVSFLVPAVYAFFTPSVARTLLGFESVSSPTATILRVTLSNAAGLLLVAPAVLLASRYDLRGLADVSVARVLEGTAVAVSLLLVGLLVFFSGSDIAHSPSVVIWIFPPLLWAAVQFGPLAASLAILGVAGLSMLGTASQLGPFILDRSAQGIVSLQLFWPGIWLPVMLLAAVIHEWELTENALEEQRKQLNHVSRVTTVGELSGALAHELRQPLTSILANSQAAMRLLSEQRIDVAELRNIMADIAQQDRHAAGVIARLRAFLTKREPRCESLSVEGVVRDALALSRSAIDLAGVEVESWVPETLPQVRGDRIQLLQVVLNLIVNGCESMHVVPDRDRRLRVWAMSRGEDQVQITIADRGPGLPAGRERMLFEPFFTTKDHGLGLGLAIGRSIIAAHGGRLWGENNPAGGAIFHLTLPVSQS